MAAEGGRDRTVLIETWSCKREGGFEGSEWEMVVVVVVVVAAVVVVVVVVVRVKVRVRMRVMRMNGGRRW